MTSSDKIQARRERVQQLMKEGRVMNDSMRRKRKIEIARINKIEELAERALAGLVSHSKPKSQVSVAETNITSIPEANVVLKNKMKYDQLSVAANQILKEFHS